MGWVLFVLCVWVGEVCLNAENPTIGEMVQEDVAEEEVKDRGVLFVWALAVVLGGLFVVLLTVAMARSGRVFRRRHRIGVKEKPTEHIDAWSQYRLKDSDWDDPDEDEE